LVRYSTYRIWYNMKLVIFKHSRCSGI
jgi:hypothetical protein